MHGSAVHRLCLVMRDTSLTQVNRSLNVVEFMTMCATSPAVEGGEG